MARKVLFICSQNRLRSPTAEQVFATWPGLETSSAGLNNDAENPVTPELLDWADMIFVMERTHRSKLSRKFKQHLGSTRVICLEIPDEFEYMAPDLIQLLKVRVPRYLP
ncbi:low molecular weight protein tyrosine phosphatase family protein [Luteimonas sp. RIT-PG2_3]